MSQWVLTPTGTLMNLQNVDYIYHKDRSLIFMKNNPCDEDDDAFMYEFDFDDDESLKIYFQYIKKVLNVGEIDFSWDTNDQ